MATGEITTLPSVPEDSGSSGFPPGSFKDPKRLYCKNGGFFLRIKSDGGVDGIREKSDPHSKYFQSHTSYLSITQSFFMFSFNKQQKMKVGTEAASSTFYYLPRVTYKASSPVKVYFVV